MVSQLDPPSSSDKMHLSWGDVSRSSFLVVVLAYAVKGPSREATSGPSKELTLDACRTASHF